MIRINTRISPHNEDDAAIEAFGNALLFAAYNGPESIRGLLLELATMQCIRIRSKLRADELMTFLRTLPGWSKRFKPIRCMVVEE